MERENLFFDPGQIVPSNSNMMFVKSFVFFSSSWQVRDEFLLVWSLHLSFLLSPFWCQPPFICLCSSFTVSVQKEWAIAPRHVINARFEPFLSFYCHCIPVYSLQKCGCRWPPPSFYPSIPELIYGMMFSVASVLGLLFTEGGRGRERGGELEREKRRSRKEP